MRAADLFAKEVSQADIGRELEVSHQTVSDWHKLWKVGGKQALKRTAEPGRPRKVTAADLAKVERALQKGPKANGYPTDLWTLARVAEVIENTTGVKYHPGHVWKVLRRMGWSRQRPARQALERDDEAIERWVNDRWPKVKKRPGQGSVDRLPRRERVQPPPLGESHLGAEGPDTRPHAPLQLEAPVDVGRGVLQARRQRGIPRIRHAARRLQR
jgi:transposase